MSDRCAFKRCRQPMEIQYLSWPVCAGHWANHGEKYDIRVELGPPIKDFEERLEMIQVLLTEGDDDTCKEHGPSFSGKIELFRWRPYLRGKAKNRCPASWDNLGEESNADPGS